MKAWTTTWLVFCIVCVGEINYAQAQLPGLYIDAGIKSDFFYTRELTNIQQGRLSGTYRLGLGIWKSNDQSFVLSAELGLATRVLSRKYESRVYAFPFSSPQINVITNKTLGESWCLEGGLGFAFLSANTSGSIYSFPHIPADDYRNWDILLAAGAEYKLTRTLSLIARAEWGFVPMLDYLPIGDSGELLPRYNDLFNRSLQICLRFNIIQKRHE